MADGYSSSYISSRWLCIHISCVYTYVLCVYSYIIYVCGGSAVKNPPASVGDLGSIPGSERSPGEGNDNPLQYSCLENPMDGRAWKAPWGALGSMGSQESDMT